MGFWVSSEVSVSGGGGGEGDGGGGGGGGESLLVSQSLSVSGCELALVVVLISGVGTWAGLMRFLKGLERNLEVGLVGGEAVLRVLGRRSWLDGGEELMGLSEFGGGGGVGLREKERQVVLVEWCFWFRLRTTPTAEKGEVVLG